MNTKVIVLGIGVTGLGLWLALRKPATPLTTASVLHTTPAAATTKATVTPSKTVARKVAPKAASATKTSDAAATAAAILLATQTAAKASPLSTGGYETVSG